MAITLSNRAVGVIFAGFAWDVAQMYRLQRKHDQVVENAQAIIDDNNQLREELEYMCHILMKNDIVPDEFDLIAMPHIRVTEVPQ